MDCECDCVPCEHAASERELVDLRTVTRILPSSPTSASACSSAAPPPPPASETTSESTRKETMEAAVSGNCSMTRSRAPRYSKRNSMSVYQMMHWSTTICTMRLPESAPAAAPAAAYIPLSSGMPMTRVLGRVEREKRVMSQSRDPRAERRHQSARRARTMSFWSVSAARKRRFMAKGLLVEMKWKERSGTAKSATKRLMPEHWSGEKMRHHRTEAYASVIATYNGTTAVRTWYRSTTVIMA
ncbi:Os12g0133850, partial [Oryza sativa Japonica Group]